MWICEEEDSMFRKDYPACSKEGLRMTLTIIASHGCKINCLDIQSAFLQGSLYVERNISQASTRSKYKESLEITKMCLWLI